jgi:acyl-CoA thioester hydrolase
MADPFTVRVTARGYEVDANGHVAGTVLLQYAQHARWECLRAAGIDHSALIARRLGPVSLEERIRFHHELRAGEDVEVSCRFEWGEQKTFRVEQEIRTADGTLSAEIANVGGLLDLDTRRLTSEPAAIWRSVATAPEVLNL